VLRQLEEEIDKILSMDGLRRKDHVLELNRLMLRAESVDHRLSLLKIIQVTYYFLAPPVLAVVFGIFNHVILRNPLYKYTVVFSLLSLCSCWDYTSADWQLTTMILSKT